MRIVVVGAGKVGRVLTEQLAAGKTRYCRYDTDQDSDLIREPRKHLRRPRCGGQRRLLRHPEGRL